MIIDFILWFKTNILMIYFVALAWNLCSADKVLSFFEQFLSLWHHELFQAYLVFPHLGPKIDHFPSRELVKSWCSDPNPNQLNQKILRVGPKGQ